MFVRRIDTYLEPVKMILHLLEVSLVYRVIVSVLRLLKFIKLVQIFGHFITNCSNAFNLLLAYVKVISPVVELFFGHLLSRLSILQKFELSAQRDDFFEQVFVLCAVPHMLAELLRKFLTLFSLI